MLKDMLERQRKRAQHIQDAVFTVLGETTVVGSAGCKWPVSRFGTEYTFCGSFGMPTNSPDPHAPAYCGSHENIMLWHVIDLIKQNRVPRGLALSLTSAVYDSLKSSHAELTELVEQEIERALTTGEISRSLEHRMGKAFEERWSV